MKHALITGVSGQDGAFLARYLLGKGYRVTGTSRRYPFDRYDNLSQLGIRDQVIRITMDTIDAQSVRQVIAGHAPEEIYNLAGQSSVGKSFEQPEQTFDSIATATRVLLEAVRDLELPVKIFVAGSGDCFGDRSLSPADETTPFDPQSPYADAKVAAFEHVQTFRRTHGLFACTGFLFNHESFLRPPGFVTRKIVRTALDIAHSRCHELVLGNMSIRRDWGWAPEYVDAMWRMLQAGTPEDYIIATGTTIGLADFVETAFTRLGLDWRKYVRTDPRFFRPKDISVLAADPSKAFTRLGWKARHAGTDVAGLMIEAEQAREGIHRTETGTHP